MFRINVEYVCWLTWIGSRSETGCGSGSGMIETGTWRTLRSGSLSEMRTSLCCGSDCWTDCLRDHWKEVGERASHCGSAGLRFHSTTSGDGSWSCEQDEHCHSNVKAWTDTYKVKLTCCVSPVLFSSGLSSWP